MNNFKLLSVRCAGLVLAVLILDIFRVVGFTYFHFVENDPLRTPVIVRAIGNDWIDLADGRVIKVYGGIDQEFQKLIQESAGRIDLEVSGGTVEVYVKQRRFVCGLGMPIFTVPLFQVDLDRYERKRITYGEFESGPETVTPNTKSRNKGEPFNALKPAVGPASK